MKAYSNNRQKEKAEKTDHVPGTSKGVSSYDKLVTKNANRSFKKQERVNAKNEICEHLKLENGWNIYDGQICSDCGISI